MSFMELLGARHQDWVRMAKSTGVGMYAEDVVQEMYLKIYESTVSEDDIAPNGIVKGWYIYRVIVSIAVDLHRSQGKITKVNLSDVWHLLENEQGEAYDHETDELINEVEEQMKDWHWYDRNLMHIYYKDDVSLGHISRKTGISKTSLYHSVKNGRARLKQAFEEREKKN